MSRNERRVVLLPESHSVCVIEREKYEERDLERTLYLLANLGSQNCMSNCNLSSDNYLS